MQRSIHVATIQLDVRPAPTDLRLYRADQIIQDAVQLGAELVVLPELFNTGYAYTDDNFQRAERAELNGSSGGSHSSRGSSSHEENGPTITWMKRTARRMGIHLAGTLLLLENGEIYNTMLIVAPDGRVWRYDKSYPWGWERGYFRENRQKGAARAAVAHTELGDLGMLICWDVAHPELWANYAGQVDMMVICSCPPQVNNAIYCIPPDVEIASADLGAAVAALKEEGQQVFGTMVAEQAAWLGTPAAHSMACGQFESPIPNGKGTLLGLIPGAPGLARYLPHADQLTIRSAMTEAGCILSAQGQPLARLSQASGEGFAIAEVSLPESKPCPRVPQPAARASKLAYFLSDTFLPRVTRSVYEHGIRTINKNGAR